MKTEWKHYKTVIDNEPCFIEGINIWEYEWKTNHESAVVIDSIYQVQKSFRIYCIELENKKIEFAAEEFSNCVWGIYIRNFLK